LCMCACMCVCVCVCVCVCACVCVCRRMVGRFNNAQVVYEWRVRDVCMSCVCV